MRKPILTIFYQFDPWRSSIGGIQTLIRSFIKYAPSEFEVRLVGTVDAPHGLTGSWQEAELEGRAIHFMPLLTLRNDNFKRLVPSTIKYASALLGRCFASDFMHFHRLEPTLATLHWAGEKTLFIHNDIQKQLDPKGNKQALLWQRFPAAYFALERLLLGQFNQILSCNTASMEFYRQRYPAIADRVNYLKNTVDNEIFYPLTLSERESGRRILSRQLGIAEDKRFVLFAGRLHAQKDPVLLVRSIAALNIPDVHLLIAGDGNLRDEVLSEISRLGLSGQVTMLGPVNQGELAQLQRVSSVLILTSAYEGLPLVVLEALACGVPVVTPQCGETPNLLRPGSGLVSKDRSVVAIADALRQVLLHPEDYPVDACVRAAEPYSARNVLGAVYNGMLDRWEQQKTITTVQSSFTS